MTALSAARATDSKHPGDIQDFAVAGSTTIYAGGMVMLKSDGYAAPAAASASNQGVIGIALETVNNSAGSDGDLNVKVQEGTFKVAGTTLAQTSVGLRVYAEDDQTVDETQGSNEPLAGILVQVDSATVGWVWMSWKLHSQINQTVTSYMEFVFPIPDMTKLADADIVTEVTPGFAGTIEKVFWVQENPVTTASKACTLTTEIGTTNLTGGVISLTSAECTPLGKVVAGTAVAGNNTFGATDTFSIKGSGTTAFIEGSGSIHVVCSVSTTVSP